MAVADPIDALIEGDILPDFPPARYRSNIVVDRHGIRPPLKG
jgi:hypothetical protein